MKHLEPTMADLQQVSAVVGIVGGVAGVGTACAGFMLYIYRAGYRRGRDVEQRKAQAAELKSINRKLRGRPAGGARQRRK